MDDEQYKIFLTQYKSSWDAMLEISKFYDKAILTLAGGAFGLSITFVRQIAPEIAPKTLIYLTTAWGSFTISLLSTIVSLLTTHCALNRNIELLEKQYIHCEDIQKVKNIQSNITWSLSILSAIAFIVGAISLAIFSIRNI